VFWVSGELGVRPMEALIASVKLKDGVSWRNAGGVSSLAFVSAVFSSSAPELNCLEEPVAKIRK